MPGIAPSAVGGALVGAATCVMLAPYLARLTVSVPDREYPRWWRGRAAPRRVVARVALLGLVLGGLAGAAAGTSALLPAFIVLAALCTPLVMIDVAVHRLPNRLVAPAAISALVLLGIAALIRRDAHALLRAVEGAAATFAVLLGIAVLAPRSFGFGDVKLGGILGSYLGWFGWAYVYYGIFAGFLLGSLAAAALLLTRRASMKTAMAFGPMLVFGVLVVLAFRLVPG